MIKNNIKLFLKYYFPILLWMGVIFYFSSIEGGTARGEVGFWFYVERKGAHIFEYAVLTLLILRAVLRSFETKKEFIFKIVLAGIVALMYAISDEIHQSFVSGREGKISDVGIDTIGIIGAIFLVVIFYKNKKLSK